MMIYSNSYINTRSNPLLYNTRAHDNKTNLEGRVGHQVLAGREFILSWSARLDLLGDAAEFKSVALQHR